MPKKGDTIAHRGQMGKVLSMKGNATVLFFDNKVKSVKASECQVIYRPH